MRTIAPCKGCQDRAVGCHSSCGRYIEWCAARKEETEKIRKLKESENRYADHKCRAIARIKGRR